MDIAVNAPITLTSSAVTELKRLLSEQTVKEGEYLRVGVKGGGCSGMSYILGFDKQDSDDELYDIEGLPVLMKKAHGIYLYGIEVDFQSGLNGRGFVFKNPNASTTCGCGSSFAV